MNEQSMSWRRAGALTVNVIWGLALIAGALSVIGFGSSFHYLIDLLCHFRMQYAVCLVAAAIVFAWNRQPRRTASAVIFSGINLALILPLYLPRPQQPHQGPIWRVLEANLLASNRQYVTATEQIRRLHPDVAVLLEFTPEWNQAFAELESEFPYTMYVPRPGAFGIALLSRHPLKNGKVLSLGRSGIPAIRVDVDREGETCTILAVHVLPPIGESRCLERNQGLQQVGELAAECTLPLILVGDLNCTSWSAAFGNLVQTSGLTDSRQGFGVQPTWPVNLPGLKLPIDHCLVSKSVVVLNRFVGPPIGSDHLPVVVDVAL